MRQEITAAATRATKSNDATNYYEDYEVKPKRILDLCTITYHNESCYLTILTFYCYFMVLLP